MVLGFGSRATKKKMGGDGGGGASEHGLRSSPSLPQMTAQGVAWPSTLVDASAIRDRENGSNSKDAPASNSTNTTSNNNNNNGNNGRGRERGSQHHAGTYPAAGAAKVSFQYSAENGQSTPIPFHRPFRLSQSNRDRLAAPGRGDVKPGSIAALYLSSNANANAGTAGTGTGRYGQRASERAGTPASAQTARTVRRGYSQRKRAAPTFNLMVVGAQGTGKTSLLRLFLDTADISPGASAEQRASVEAFLQASAHRTEGIHTACVEICESRADRVLLSLIDTPGLDFQENHQLKLERQVSDVVKYLDLQFADTMDEEFKVVRKSKGDQHVHLCIYMIDPSSLMTPAEREVLSKPNFLRSPSLDKDAPAKPEADQLCMSPLDLRIIRRLSDRVNVLPVIAHSDTLTDERLSVVKQAVSREFARTKLGFGVFGTPRIEEEPVPAPAPASMPSPPSGSPALPKPAVSSSSRSVKSARSTGSSSRPQTEDEAGEGDSSEDEHERRPRARVIKLNQRRRSLARSTSRSRLELVEEEDKHTPMALDHADPESLAAVRFSAGFLADALKKPPPLQSNGHSVKNGGGAGAGEGKRARMSNRERLRQFQEMMPFAVIMPEPLTTPHRRALKAPPPLRPVSAYSTDSGYPLTPLTQNGDHVGGAEDKADARTPTAARGVAAAPDVGSGDGLAQADNKENGNGNGILTPAPSAGSVPAAALPKSASSDNVAGGGAASYSGPGSSGLPRDLKGVFVRRFRWGTVDVLDPTHCDFAALRTAVFSTHMKVLKTHTKEVLYEKYRTEKLLARRATRNISEEERKRLLEDLGL